MNVYLLPNMIKKKIRIINLFKLSTNSTTISGCSLNTRNLHIQGKNVFVEYILTQLCMILSAILAFY